MELCLPSKIKQLVPVSVTCLANIFTDAVSEGEVDLGWAGPSPNGWSPEKEKESWAQRPEEKAV